MLRLQDGRIDWCLGRGGGNNPGGPRLRERDVADLPAELVLVPRRRSDDSTGALEPVSLQGGEMRAQNVPRGFAQVSLQIIIVT